MKTSKPFSTVSYNTDEFLKSKLNELLKTIYEKDYKNTRVTIDVNPNNMVWCVKMLWMGE